MKILKSLLHLMKTKNERASKEVLSYIENIFRVCYQDCSDSGEWADRHEDRFNALVADEVKIADYIRQFHLQDYADEFQRFYNENLKGSYDLSNVEEPTVMATPLHFNEVKHLIKL